MRFSLRWLFIAMAYLALVAGAVMSRSTALSTLVWWVTAIASCYAVVVFYFVGGRSKAMALGFVLMSATHFAVVYFAPSRTPAAQLFSGIGYVVLGNDEFLVVRSSRGDVLNGRAIFSTANAAGTMLAGLLGCGIGALAYRHSHEP